jgi:hypothetical protein
MEVRSATDRLVVSNRGCSFDYSFFISFVLAVIVIESSCQRKQSPHD